MGAKGIEMGQSQTQNLKIQQSQTLSITKDLQEAIKLLQLSQVELGEYIESEMLQNPLLELQEESFEPDDSEKNDENRDAAQLDFSDQPSKEKHLDTDFENVWDPNLSLTFQKTGNSNSDFDPILNYAKDENLRDYLQNQINLSTQNSLLRKICFYLIDHLDHHGYLYESLLEIARDLKVEYALVEEALSVLHKLDPPGIGARSLSECLELQLKEQGIFNQEIELILNHLDLIAQKDLKKLHQKTGLSEEKILNWIKSIQSLNPYPASLISDQEMQAIVPDLFLVPLPNGQFRIELNQESLPKIALNKSYYGTLKKHVKSEQDKTYLQNAYQSASWLMKAIEQRANTLQKVSEKIVEHQIAFFRHGLSAMKPLILKDIADEVEMHESTISRVTTNKYIATPNGVYELKFFFTTSLQNAFGEQEISSEFVRHRIKTLIQEEAYPKILSDDNIVEILKKEGITIARRTVTKYREAMNLSSSIIRRQQKKPLINSI